MNITAHPRLDELRVPCAMNEKAPLDFARSKPVFCAARVSNASIASPSHALVRFGSKIFQVRQALEYRYS